jgi:hypothetical protein
MYRPNLWRVPASVICLAALSSCPETPKELVDQSYDLAVVLLQPLDSSLLPEDIVTLAMPISSDACPGRTYTPALTLVPGWPHPTDRVSVSTSPERDWTDVIRQFYRAPRSLDARRKGIQRHLTRLQLPSGLLRQSDHPALPTNALATLPQGTEGRILFALTGPMGQEGASLVIGHLVALAYADVDPLTAAIADRLCASSSARATQGVTVVYRYEPSAGQLPPGSSTSSCDNLYDTLVGRAQDVREAPERVALDDALRAAANSDCPNDYRFPYERGRLAAVYGMRRHDAAFAQLYEAADRAILNSLDRVMLRRLRADGAPGGDLHRLSDHHEWDVLLEALAARDVEMVRRVH